MRPIDPAPALGFGGAAIAYPGLESGLHNDAQLGFARGWGLSAASAIPFGITDWKTGAASACIGLKGSSGMGLDIVFSGTIYYSEQRTRLAFGRKLGEKIMLGISADILHVSASGYGGTTKLTGGLGVLAHPLPQFWIGAAIRNPFLQKIGEDPVPSILRIGACWEPSGLFRLVAETEKYLERPPQTKVGFEYRPGDLLTIRAGIRSTPARAAFGVGLRLKKHLRIDLGSEWHPVLGLTTALMISWN